MNLKCWDDTKLVNDDIVWLYPLELTDDIMKAHIHWIYLLMVVAAIPSLNTRFITVYI